MTRDPFLRLALIAAVSAWLTGLAEFQQLFGWWWFAAVLVGSLALAAALSITIEPSPERDPRWRRWRQPKDGTRGFERIE